MSTTPDVMNQDVARREPWLQRHRIAASLWTAVIEGALVVLGVLSWWLIVPLAVIAIGFWIWLGRGFHSVTARQASWIFATSQAIVVLVPLIFSLVKGLAIALVVILAIGALFFLFRERV